MDFKERFKGRTTTMNKDGVIGIVASTGKPIEKTLTNFLPQHTDDYGNKTENINAFKSYQKQSSPLNKTASHKPDLRDNVNISPRMNYNQNANYSIQKPSQGPKNMIDSPFHVSNPYPEIVQTVQYTISGQKTVMDPNAIANRENTLQSKQQYSPGTYPNQQFQQKPPLGPPKTFSSNQEKGFQHNSNQNFRQNFENPHNQFRMAGEATMNFGRMNINRADDFELQSQYNMNNGMNGYPNMTGMSNTTVHRNNRFNENGNVMFVPQPYNSYQNFHGEVGGDYIMNPMEQPQYYTNQKPPLTQYTNQMLNTQIPMMQRQPLYSNQNPFGYTAGGSNTNFQIETGEFQNRGYSANHDISFDRSKSISGSKNLDFKPYTLKDYKVMKDRMPSKLGGLGANVGTGDWQEKRKKNDKIQNFSDNVRAFNSQKSLITEKAERSDMKEKSKREIALEFAKNVPKPKPKTVEDIIIPTKMRFQSPMAGDDPGVLEMMEKQHSNYMNQISKIK